jgi:hypothetical protein
VGEPGNVARYRIDELDGRLTPLGGTVPAGRDPQAIAVASGFAFVPNYWSGDLSHYRIDSQNGTFTLLDPSVATGGTPSGVAISVPEELQAQQDMVERAAREAGFGLQDIVTYGTPLLMVLDPQWSFRKMNFEFSVESVRYVVVMIHATSTSDSTVRFTNYQNPLTGEWAGWEQASATVREAVHLGSAS